MPNTTYPNYETKFSTSPVENKLNTDAQMDLYKRDEKTQKAPKILPFELEQNAQRMLGDMTVKLIEFRNMIHRSDISETDKRAMDELIDTVATSLTMTIPKQIDKLYL